MSRVTGVDLDGQGNVVLQSQGGAQASGQLDPGTEWSALDSNYLAWNYPPTLAASASLLVGAGLVHLMAMKLPKAAQITNVIAYLSNAGVTLTPGQCFAAVYGPDRALLGVSADQAASWVTPGLKVIPLAGGPFFCQPGIIRVALFANGSTMPGFIRNISNAPQANAGLAAANSRWGTDSTNTGRTTTMPATIGTIAAAAADFWAAVS